MAVSELKTIPYRFGSRSAATLLFGPERLPDRLFAPLSSPNRHQYWALLCRLYAKRFGPDAPLPPSHGFAVREIMQDIEDELVTQDLWENEDDSTPDTPIAIRSNAVFNRLIESGWFRLERHGVEKKVTMRPMVSQFLTVLVSFAENGPVFVSGKIRSIDLNIQQIAEGKADGDTLAETAEQARNLLEHVRNTGTNIRDLMESLGAEITTAQYVQRYFKDFIERVFIGDYRELRTREHPLSRGPQILRTVEELYASDHHRTRLIAWYAAKRCAGDGRKAEQLFEKDILRLFELRRINEYLDRLSSSSACNADQLQNRHAQLGFVLLLRTYNYSNKDNNASCFSGGSFRNTVSMARSASASTQTSRGDGAAERVPLLRRCGFKLALSRASISAFRLRPFNLASRFTNARTSSGMRSPKGFISRVIALLLLCPLLRRPRIYRSDHIGNHQ